MTSLFFRHRLKSLPILIFLNISTVFSESMQVDYYGVVSSSSDANMLKMAQDVFLTQLKSIDGISVDDKRPDLSRSMQVLPEFPENSRKIAFYAEIAGEKNNDGQTIWNCKFTARTPEDGIEHSKNESYESYYKILTGAKSAIETVLNDVKGKNDAVSEAEIPESSVFVAGADIEALAGTWGGEPYTDKIIILRGGRGFVIFKNGATMNIKITKKNLNINGQKTTLEITQTGKSNASFFPDLPRETALKAASTANPITWNFTLTSTGTLEGVKTTLLESPAGAEEGTQAAIWARQ